MAQETEAAIQIQTHTGLKPKHFADLVRVAQLVFDPTGGLTGRRVEVDWESFEVPSAVVKNLREIGHRYQYASPYVAIEVLWEQLAPETRSWFMENRNNLGYLEEALPARDED